MSCSVTLSVAVFGETGRDVTLTLSLPRVASISPNVLFASINRFNVLALVVLRTQTLNAAPPLMVDPVICAAGNAALVNRLSKRMLPSSLPLTLLVPLTPSMVELVREKPVTFVPRMPKLVKSFNCIHDNETPDVPFRKIPVP